MQIATKLRLRRLLRDDPEAFSDDGAVRLRVATGWQFSMRRAGRGGTWATRFVRPSDSELRDLWKPDLSRHGAASL